MNIFSSSAWLEFWNTMVSANLLTTISLFKNDHVPAFTDTIADYTPADFSGYVGPTALAWGSAFVNGSDQGEIDALPVTWTHTGGATANTIYGIYVLSSAGDLIYAERFPAPLAITSIGDSITYVAKATVIDQ